MTTKGRHGHAARVSTRCLRTEQASQHVGVAPSINYLVDTDAGVIVDVEARTANRKDEVASSKTMVERVEKRFALKPKRLIGDTAYGSAEMLAWMVDNKGIEPHVPV